MKSNNWVQQLNKFGEKREACFFIIDFHGNNGQVYSLNQLKDEQIYFDFPEFNLQNKFKTDKTTAQLTKKEIDKEVYGDKFRQVLEHLNRGNTYLVNLTFSTPIELDVELEELYAMVTAKYKVNYKNQWVCFSPEIFIKITNNRISTYPMKGTIDAKIPNAENILKTDKKEKAEHSTIVDLLRNDLSMVARDVHVSQLMYIDKLTTNQGDILQMSSEIAGDLDENWHSNMGEILHTLLPAGSISGAPKKKTLEIISSVENHVRGFYTGIAGYYDGKKLDSCVLIRFIEKTDKGLVYKSGGGITAMSDEKKEYQELNQKIYVATKSHLIISI